MLKLFEINNYISTYINICWSLKKEKKIFNQLAKKKYCLIILVNYFYNENENQ